MKKFLLTAVFFTAILCGCAEETGKVDVIPQEESVAEEIVTEAPTERVTKPAQRVTPAAGVYVYDFAERLTAEELAKCNEIAAKISNKIGISAGAVIAENLGGKVPYDYAEMCYKDLFGEAEDGILVLINDDSSYDYVYKKGICSELIDERSESEAMFHATKDIVGGNYRDGVLRLLNLGGLCGEDEVASEEEE